MVSLDLKNDEDARPLTSVKISMVGITEFLPVLLQRYDVPRGLLKMYELSSTLMKKSQRKIIVLFRPEKPLMNALLKH